MTTEPQIYEDALPGTEGDMAERPQYMPRYPGSGRLDGKIALITGADSGIGRAVAVLFAREGADIGIAYLNEHDDAEETRVACEAEGAQCVLLPGDIGDKTIAEGIVAKAVETLGGLDIVVNNAGEQHADPDIADITEAQLRRTFQTNVFGMFFITQAALPHLSAGAAIVNSTSVTSFEGSKELIDYSSTKGAITSFTRALAAQLVDKGIRVNAVAPGPIWTPLNPSGGATPEKLATFGESTPMGRKGQPNEVAPAYLFLACEDASYVTAQVISVNGGTPVGS